MLERFALPFKALPEAVNAVMGLLQLAACDGSGELQPKAKMHMLLLSGVFLGGTRVLARVQVAVDAAAGTQLKIGVRSESAAINRIVADCIQ